MTGMKGQSFGKHHLMSGGTKHPERKNKPPQSGIVSKALAFPSVFPECQRGKKRNPPRRNRPEEERHSLQEGQEGLQDSPVWRAQNKERSGKSGDGRCAHVDPVKGIEVPRRKGKEVEAKYDLRNQNDLAPDHPPPVEGAPLLVLRRIKELLGQFGPEIIRAPTR